MTYLSQSTCRLHRLSSSHTVKIFIHQPDEVKGVGDAPKKDYVTRDMPFSGNNPIPCQVCGKEARATTGPVQVVGTVLSGSNMCCVRIDLDSNSKILFKEEHHKYGGGTDSSHNVIVKPTQKEAAVSPTNFDC